MTAARSIKEATGMEMFTAGVRTIRQLLRLPVRRSMPAIREESGTKDELVMARIARTCPDLIVMANELRFRVT